MISRTSFLLFFVCFIFSKGSAQNVSKTDLAASNRATNTSDKTFVTPAKGPLQQFAENPNYFTDGSGKAIYLVGSHTWSNFQDMRFEGDKNFDYDQYMDFMVENHFNFMRLWTWEQSAWATWTPEKLIVDPVPYLRTGPGLAIDGKPRYDLTKFDQSYFDRMRARIIKARDHGIYASIMLFQAFSGVVTKFPNHDNNVFRGHYYNKDNNIQNFNGDKNDDKVLDLDDSKVQEYQASYIKKIIDNVWDLDNVLYEVINEGGTLGWDRFVIKTVQDYEKTKGKQHPVGITGHSCEKLEDMLQSTAQWISPGSNDGPGFEDVFDNPPLWNGKKVCVLDTDHMWGVGIDYHWVWYSFLRGHNVLFMDPWDPLPTWHDDPQQMPDLYNYVQGRKAMKNTAILAGQLNLAVMKPSKDIASSGFCLANPGKEYIVYVKADTASIDLTGITGTFSVEWMHPTEGFITKGKDIKGGGKEILSTPFKEEAVAHIKLMK